MFLRLFSSNIYTVMKDKNENLTDQVLPGWAVGGFVGGAGLPHTEQDFGQSFRTIELVLQ